MTSANVALRAAVHDALAADSGLHALLGGKRVYDEPPRGALLPYVAIGEARVTDLFGGRGTDAGASDHASCAMPSGRPK